MKSFLRTGLTCLVLSSAAMAQDSADMTDLNQVQLRYSECTAFYYAGAVGFNSIGKAEEADTLNAQAHATLELAVATGVRIGLTEQEMNSRIASAERWIMQRAGNDLTNFEELVDELGPRCLELLQYPPKALFDQPTQPAGE